MYVHRVRNCRKKAVKVKKKIVTQNKVRLSRNIRIFALAADRSTTCIFSHSRNSFVGSFNNEENRISIEEKVTLKINDIE